MKKVLLVFLALIITASASAEEIYSETDDLIYYYPDPAYSAQFYDKNGVEIPYVIISGLTEAGKQKEEIVIPEEINGVIVNQVEPYYFESDNLKRLILPDKSIILGVDYTKRTRVAGGFHLPNLEYVNLDVKKVEVSPGAFAGCPKLHTISSDGKNIVNSYLGRGALRNTEVEEVTLNTVSVRTSISHYPVPGYIFENCKKLRTVHFSVPRKEAYYYYKLFDNIVGQELIQGLFMDCTALDYICLDDNVFGAFGRTFQGCENLRSLVIPEADFEFRCGAYTDPYSSYVEYCAVDGENPEKTIDPQCVFKDNPKLTVFCVGGTSAEEYLKKHGVRYITSIIPYGEPSTVVAQAKQTAMVYINGIGIPAYTVNGSVYVGESALKSLGFGMDWDGEARTTTVTKPENVQWLVGLCANSEPYTIDVFSSDVKFMLNGFPIPALNVGNGESMIDVNALAEAVLY